MDKTVAECPECGNYDEALVQGGKFYCRCNYCDEVWRPSSEQLRNESELLAERERIMAGLEEEQKKQADWLTWRDRNPEVVNLTPKQIQWLMVQERNPEAAEALLNGSACVVPLLRPGGITYIPSEYDMRRVSLAEYAAIMECNRLDKPTTPTTKGKDDA